MSRMRLEEALKRCSLSDTVNTLLQILLDMERESALAATSNDSRLQFELSTLPSSTPGLKMALVTSKPPLPDKLWLSVPLSVSLDGLLEASGVTEPEEMAHLRSQFSLSAYFPVNTSSSSAGQKKEPELPELTLNEYLSTGNSYWLSRLPTPFVIPTWTKSSCLMEFVPFVSEKLQAALDSLAARHVAKNLLFEHLFSIMGPPIEYHRSGSMALFSLSSTLENQSLPVLIFIDASNMPKFPEGGPPLLTVTNVRAMGMGDGGSTTFTDGPWSPRWPPDEMASRILTFLKLKVPMFLKDPSSNKKTGFFEMFSGARSMGGSFDSPNRGNSPPPGSSPSKLSSLVSGKIGDDPTPTSR